jgi:hypothetical protein
MLTGRLLNVVAEDVLVKQRQPYRIVAMQPFGDRLDAQTFQMNQLPGSLKAEQWIDARRDDLLLFIRRLIAR